MKTIFRGVSMWVGLAAFAAACYGQIAGGSAAFGQGRTSLDQARAVELAKRRLPENVQGRFVEAAVLLNVDADRYVAHFAISSEGKTLELAQKSMDERLAILQEKVRALGIAQAAMNVDFVAQNRTYAFQVDGGVAREVLDGFEVKKTVAIRYEKKELLDRMLIAASEVGIFDLVKVDYLVDDLDAVRKRLMKEAGRIIKEKLDEQAQLLGAKPGKPRDVVTTAFGTYFPNELYDSYVPEESAPFFSSYTSILRLRKPRTIYWNGFTSKDFDSVLEPAKINPTVQFMVFVRVRN